MKLYKRLWRKWVRLNMCRLRGHSWTGATFFGFGGKWLYEYRIYCSRCNKNLTNRDCEKGEPKRFKLPYGDNRRINGRIYE